jgi:signal transduction histidine kinase
MQSGQLSPDEEIRLLKEELRHTQKMAALGELTSTTTHEFNNVLTTILNYAKLGLRHTDTPTRDKALGKILDAARRAEKITNGVLGLARNRGNDRSPADLAALVEQVLVLMERELRKYRVQVETDFHPAPPALVCGNQIQQVLLNLLTNARQAMPGGGHIRIRIAPDDKTQTVDITIRDTGSGIPPSELPKIFDRYYSTKQGPDASGKGGSGLGLGMCREILEQHHGRIRVESAVNVGTAFTLKLPMAPQGRSTAPIPSLGVPGVLSMNSGALP